MSACYVNGNAVSPFLKKVITKNKDRYPFHEWSCLDAPSGYGRNTFFLNDHFKSVTAIDININFLKVIEDMSHGRHINTKQQDLLEGLSIDFSRFDMICVVHFYKQNFIQSVLRNMRKGAILLMETPACYGENFLDLPTQSEVENMFKEVNLLAFDFRACKHEDNAIKRGSLKVVLEK